MPGDFSCAMAGLSKSAVNKSPVPKKTLPTYKDVPDIESNRDSNVALFNSGKVVINDNWQLKEGYYIDAEEFFRAIKPQAQLDKTSNQIVQLHLQGVGTRKIATLLDLKNRYLARKVVDWFKSEFAIFQGKKADISFRIRQQLEDSLSDHEYISDMFSALSGGVSAPNDLDDILKSELDDWIKRYKIKETLNAIERIRS